MRAFDEQSHAFLRGVLDPRHLRALADYLHGLAGAGFDADPEVPHSLRRHGGNDVVMNALSDRLQPLVERTTGRRLTQTNTFSRIYYTGAELLKHRDRGHCEVSCSVTVDRDAGEMWPLRLSIGGADLALPIDAGDLAIYLGCEVAHWRDRFAGRRWTQLLLHYVDAKEPGDGTLL